MDTKTKDTYRINPVSGDEAYLVEADGWDMDSTGCAVHFWLGTEDEHTIIVSFSLRNIVSWSKKRK